MSSPQTTPAELAAVADAIRGHDRFLVTTHENPDGDALGSLLATKLALEQLGKDVVIYLFGDVPLPSEYSFMELDDLRQARVFVSVLGSVRSQQTSLAALQAAHGVLQSRVARELRMKRTPQLTFEYDPSVERGVRISKLIDELTGDDDSTRASDDG